MEHIKVFKVRPEYMSQVTMLIKQVGRLPNQEMLDQYYTLVFDEPDFDTSVYESTEELIQSIQILMQVDGLKLFGFGDVVWILKPNKTVERLIFTSKTMCHFYSLGSKIDAFVLEYLGEIEGDLEQLEDEIDSFHQTATCPVTMENNVINKTDMLTIDEEINSLATTLLLLMKVHDELVVGEQSKEIMSLFQRLATKHTQIQEKAKLLPHLSDNIKVWNESQVNIRDTLAQKDLNTEDWARLLSISVEDFILQLEEIPFATKKLGYVGLLQAFLLDIKQYQFNANAYTREVADDLHQLPHFISCNFHGFDEHSFWNTIFQSVTKNYFLEHYYRSIWGEFKVQTYTFH